MAASPVADLVVDVYDSKLNANEARNAFIAACEKDFALVGTTSLFVTTFDDVINCKDAEGQATGIPDLGGLITSLTEACSPVTFSPNAPQVQCDTVGQDPVTYQGTMGAFKYAVKQLKGDAHGALLTSNDTPDARRSGEANMLLVKKAGVKPDVEVSLSSRDPQSAFTPIVQEHEDQGLELLVPDDVAEQCDPTPTGGGAPGHPVRRRDLAVSVDLLRPRGHGRRRHDHERGDGRPHLPAVRRDEVQQDAGELRQVHGQGQDRRVRRVRVGGGDALPAGTDRRGGEDTA